MFESLSHLVHVVCRQIFAHPRAATATELITVTHDVQQFKQRAVGEFAVVKWMDECLCLEEKVAVDEPGSYVGYILDVSGGPLFRERSERNVLLTNLLVFKYFSPDQFHEPVTDREFQVVEHLQSPERLQATVVRRVFVSRRAVKFHADWAFETTLIIRFEYKK